jgi:hypothetical protein
MNHDCNCYEVNGRDSTRHDENGWLIGKIKTFHEFDFQITFGGKRLEL